MNHRLRRAAAVLVVIVGALAAIATGAPYHFHRMEFEGPRVHLGPASRREYSLVLCAPEPYRDEGFFRASGVLRDADIEPELIVIPFVREGSVTVAFEAASREVGPDEEIDLHHEPKLQDAGAGRFCGDPVRVAFETAEMSAVLDWTIRAEVYLELEAEELPITVEVRES